MKMQKTEDHNSDRDIIENIDNSTQSNAITYTDDTYVEITLDVREDTVAVHSVKNASGANVEEAELQVLRLAKNLRKKQSFGTSVVRNTSIRMRQVAQELKRLATLKKQQPHPSRRFDRTNSVAAHHALKGLKFISKTDGGAGWAAVEKRFHELSATSDGLLPRAKFGECIGKRTRV